MVQFGTTKNISSGGVLFTIEKEPEIGASIEYLITLGSAADHQKVTLRCVGKVLRANRMDSESAYDIAATLERYEFVRSE